MTGSRQNTMALVSLIAGVAGWTFFPTVGAIVAIIMGHMARAEIRRTGEDGDQLALMGLILGYSHFVMICIVFAVIAVMYVGFFAVFLGLAASEGQI